MSGTQGVSVYHGLCWESGTSEKSGGDQNCQALRLPQAWAATVLCVCTHCMPSAVTKGH